MSEVRTQATYEAIAAAYTTRNRDRGALTGDRNRFLALVPHGGRILDAGCGPGHDAAIFQRLGYAVVGLDLSPGMLRAGRAAGVDVPVAVADMRALPLTPCFDAVWACASLLHIPRDQAPAVLLGFARVLRPGGVLYLSVKRGQGVVWQAGAYGANRPRRFTLWSAAALDGALGSAGFTVDDGQGVSEPEGVWLARLARRG